MRRFSSVSSFSSFASSLVRQSSTLSDAKSTHSAIEEALTSSLLPPSTPPLDRLTLANDELVSSLEALQVLHRAAYSQRLALVARIHHLLQTDPDTRNTLREHNGFLSVVSVLASLDESAAVGGGDQADSFETRSELRYELARSVFSILSVACEGHDLNRAAFVETVGFDAVGEAIKLSGLMREQEGGEGAAESASASASSSSTPSPAERTLSILWAFLTGDFASPPLFTQVRRHLADSDLTTPRPPSGEDRLPEEERTPTPPPSAEDLISSFLLERCDALKGADCEVVDNPAVTPLILELEASLGEDQPELRFAVLAALLQLATSSRRSQVALNSAGVVEIALERLWSSNLAVPTSESPAGKVVLRGLTECLLEMGASTKETRKMFQSVVEGWEDAQGHEKLNEDMLSLILAGVRHSRSGSFIHFDLSRHGHSSLTLRSLGRQFPPPTHGYTYLAWISIEDPPTEEDQRLIVFGCGDATGKCHLEISIGPDLHLYLATSLSKPPVLFSAFTFELKRFYHLAVVHQRPKFSSNSPVSLYIDGKLVDSIKTTYPVPPPKDWEVQGWLGTPKDRVPAGRLEKGTSQLKWDLGPTWLIHGDVPAEMIYVCSTLGPRYACNFQDQLGQFQTNASSTLLNVRLDEDARNSKSSKHDSPLVYAIRDKGSAVIPEHRIIFSFSALNVLVAGSGRGLFSSGLSSHGQQTLKLLSARGKVIVNSAIPLVEDALVLPHGLGHLNGDPVVANPKGIDVALWKLGGVPVALRLVELAKTPKQLTQTVKLFIELVGHSWRNSEDTERVQGYEIFALHLRAKPGLITPETHDALLAFVGFNFNIPTASVASNSLAFRFLALDFALWGMTEPAIQWAHFDRLREFVERSEHKDFNTRRLTKMHVVRKLLYALRVNYFDHSMLPEVVELLVLLLEAHFSTESVRHVATFLTATLCQTIEQRPPLSSVSPRAPTPPVASVDPTTSFVLDASEVEMGPSRPALRVLLGLHNLLLRPGADNELAKFAKIITAKWTLLFLLDKAAHPLAAVLALRILIRLLQTQGNSYVVKFINSADGFAVLRVAVPRLWQYGQIHLALFALMHGHDITTLPLDAAFASATFALSATEVSPVAAEVTRIIIAAIGRGIKALPGTEDAVGSVVNVPSLAITAPDASSPELGHHPVPISSIPLAVGFDTLLDLLSQTTRSVGASQRLVDGPIPLGDLALVLLPHLHIPVSFEYPANAPIPLLPILSSHNGYRLHTPVPEPPTPTPQTAPNGRLKLQIPAHLSATDVLASPLTGLDDGGHEFPIGRSTGGVSAAAMAVVRFLGQQITHQITNRSVHRHTGSGIDPASAPSTDPALRILRDTFSAAAPGDVGEQVAFRTLILRDVFRRLSRASTTPLVAARIASLVSLAADLSFEGWNADLEGLLDFVLLYLEKLLDDAILAASSPHSRSLDSLFRSLNRVILLSLSHDREESNRILKLLTRHQLSVFASPNTDAEFFRCLVQRLDSMLRTSTAGALDDAIIDIFKLLILQRPTEVEVSLVQHRRHASEAPIIEKLIDTDNDGFVAILKEYREQLDSLESSWDAFVEDEGLRARRAAEVELARLDDLVKASKHKRDLARRRTRKQRGSIYEWSEGIFDVEATRVAHTRQDISDLQSFIQTEWFDQTKNLQREAGIWGASSSSTDRKWRLDFTEGHNRMRKKLQAEVAKRPRHVPSPVQHSTADHSRSLGATRQDSYSASQKQLEIDGGSSPLASPLTPKEENMWGENFSQPYDPATVELDAADGYEDKNRKVRRSLEPGDVIKSVFNVNRIVGLDACPGLLLLARKNIYVIDNFFQRASGELVDAWDAPAEERDQHLQTLSDLAGRDSKSAVADLDTAHRSRRWTWSDLVEVHERKYLFRSVALELFFADGRSFLLTFAQEQRSRAYAFIADYAPSAVAFGSLNVTGSSIGSKLTDVMLGQRTKLERLTKRWERREVSNFEYLMFLNTSAGRTYNDLTNYPVFPHILADYTSDKLDLSREETFRDLSKPMGAQSEERRKEFQDRYSQLQELHDGTQPFHYGTHYSSAMIVVSYLVRLQPFTTIYLDLQGGSFDHADRMFWSIPNSWISSSKQSRSDVRELIPEFFYLPDFLLNESKLELGTRQETGGGIDSVELPPWAKGDPRLFVELHREALESEYVSQNLGKWIDLIFGYRQTGEAAVEACNVFHHLSYEGAIDLDKIEDPNERKAATSTIHNFGMTPRQLFTKPHPLRTAPLVPKATHPLFSPNLFVEAQASTLIQSIVPIFELANQISTIYAVPGAPDKTVATTTQTLFIPDASNSHLVSWGFADHTVRLYVKGNSLPTSLFENMHSEFVSAACFADTRTFVTASTDTTVSVWKFRWRSNGGGHFQQLACLRGHSDQVCCVAASRAFSVVVSGSDDRTAIIWDLNRHRFVHRIEGHENRVHLVTISDTTGDIVTCSGAVLSVHTVNGVLLGRISTSNYTDAITSVAVSKSETAPIFATGHRSGKIMLWERIPSSEPTGFSLHLLHTLKYKDRFDPAQQPDITALSFTSRGLYVGDELGKLWQFSAPGTDLFFPDSTGNGSCMACFTKFGLIETRRRCASCAGIFCSLCTTTSLEVGGRFCSSCFGKLSPLMAGR